MSNTTYVHTITGRTFTATRPGSFGAGSVDGRWDTEDHGTIWPGDTTHTGDPLWTVVIPLQRDGNREGRWTSLTERNGR